MGQGFFVRISEISGFASFFNAPINIGQQITITLVNKGCVQGYCERLMYVTLLGKFWLMTEKGLDIFTQAINTHYSSFFAALGTGKLCEFCGIS